jgi:hypothetical protein
MRHSLEADPTANSVPATASHLVGTYSTTLQAPHKTTELQTTQTDARHDGVQVDSKKELERALKAGCEAFIMGATKLAVDDMLSFITKVTAVRVAASSKPLREQVGTAAAATHQRRCGRCSVTT